MCCVWDSLGRVWGSKFVMCGRDWMCVWGSDIVLCVGEFGEVLGE